jgi:hypothetical protein
LSDDTSRAICFKSGQLLPLALGERVARLAASGSSKRPSLSSTQVYNSLGVLESVRGRALTTKPCLALRAGLWVFLAGVVGEVAKFYAILAIPGGAGFGEI